MLLTYLKPFRVSFQQLRESYPLLSREYSHTLARMHTRGWKYWVIIGVYLVHTLVGCHMPFDI